MGTQLTPPGGARCPLAGGQGFLQLLPLPPLLLQLWMDGTPPQLGGPTVPPPFPRTSGTQRGAVFPKNPLLSSARGCGDGQAVGKEGDEGGPHAVLGGVLFSWGVPGGSRGGNLVLQVLVLLPELLDLAGEAVALLQQPGELLLQV